MNPVLIRLQARPANVSPRSSSKSPFQLPWQEGWDIPDASPGRSEAVSIPLSMPFPSFIHPLLKIGSTVSFSIWLVACSGGRNISSATAYNPGYGPFDQNGNYVEAWADKPARQHAWKSKLSPPESASGPVPPVVVSRNKPAAKPPTLLASQAPPSRPGPELQPQPPRPAPPKPAPSPTIRHTVVKGDTLYSLGRRYGTSVGAIQRANGIRGTIIRIGQKLKIPR